EKKMFCAFAVDKEKKLAPTLGKADFLLILDDKGKEISFQAAERNIYQILTESGAEKLFCGGIGNCSCMLLESSGVELLCGCREKSDPAELLKEYLQGSLTRNKECFCTSSGRSCGECPGKF
ncbi:MAG: hypothetical protein IKC08_01145, partial [Lentisphaeria bacterium]|nr:hypothetical protein [Lentisphaeria bacterium]